MKILKYMFIIYILYIEMLYFVFWNVMCRELSRVNLGLLLRLRIIWEEFNVYM